MIGYCFYSYKKQLKSPANQFDPNVLFMSRANGVPFEG